MWWFIHLISEMEKFIGTWKVTETENLEQMLKALGKKRLLRP